jgi:hypothetical protein
MLKKILWPWPLLKKLPTDLPDRPTEASKEKQGWIRESKSVFW